MNLKKQQGFTLIELMIVIAIIAVLAAIALPAYADYLRRSKVSELIVGVSASRTGISEWVASHNALPTAASYVPESVATKYVASIGWNGTTVTATAQGIGSGIDGNTVTLTPDNSKVASGVIPKWTCSGSIASKYRPGTCQG